MLGWIQAAMQQNTISMYFQALDFKVFLNVNHTFY